MKEIKVKILNLALMIVPIVCILLFWQYEAKKINNEFILTDVGVTFKALIDMLKQKEFYKYLWGTLARTLIAFVVSFIIATSLAFLSRISKKIDVMISPVISIVRSLPTIAVILLLILWTNSKIASIVVTSLVVLPTTYSSMRDAFYTVDDELIKGLKLYKVSTCDMFLKVYFPQILPPALLAIGGGIALNLKLMVAAEVLAQTADSLGYLLNTAKVYFEIAKMIAVVVVSVAIGLIVESTFRFISKKVGKWQ